MSPLNILCAICSEYFKNNDVIYSTRCGHVFHKSCLFKWIKLSSSCPQCRRCCLRNLCHQVFVNFAEASPEDNDVEMEYSGDFNWIYADHDTDYSHDMSFAFMFGWDEEGCDIYLARCRFNGDLLPGYYIASKGEVIVSCEFQSHCLTEDIELLDISNDNDAQYKWISASNGDIPENAFPTGITLKGHILYTARALHEGKMLYGKLDHCSSEACLPYEDKEVKNSVYEVLVRIPRLLTTSEPIPEKEIKDIVKDL